MISRIHGMTLQGIDATACEVEVDVARGGLGELNLVGLPDTAIKESISRIQAAMRNSGYRWPGPKVTISLAPADVKKEGNAFDLPIALGVMLAGGELVTEKHAGLMVLGELALDGRLRPVKGALAAAMLAKRHGLAGVLLPRDNAPEAAVVDGLAVYGVDTLAQAVGFLTEELDVPATAVDLDSVFAGASHYDVDFGDVRGQAAAKRAMLVAASGHHNLLMIGPPGSGKTVSARLFHDQPSCRMARHRACGRPMDMVRGKTVSARLFHDQPSCRMVRHRACGQPMGGSRVSKVRPVIPPDHPCVPRW